MTNVAEELSQSQIWPVLDQLRSELPTHEMGVALAALIYLRWADFQDAEQEAIATFEEVDFEPMLPPSLHWRSWLECSPEQLARLLRERLPRELDRLGNARHSALATNLHRLRGSLESVSRLTPRPLESLVRWLADQPFETPSDRRRLLEQFDQLLDKTNTKHAGQFRTPPAIVKLVIDLAAPRAGERLYDPCFGWAGFLSAAADYVREHEKDRHVRQGPAALSIAGVDINQASYAIALARLALAGVEDPQLELGNSLERAPSDRPGQDGFDVVVANPPWGAKVDPAGMGHFPVRMTDSAGLFVQHILSQLRPEGRAIIVVPDGLLFRSGPERKLRQMLVRHHTVEAIIGLPEGAFAPFTSIRANILMLRRGGSTERIRMVDGEPFFERGRGGKPATIGTELVAELATRARVAPPGKHCWDVEVSSLAGVEWDLTPRRRDRSRLPALLESLRDKVDVVRLRDCCEIMGGTAVPARELVDAPANESLAAIQPPDEIEAERRHLQRMLEELTSVPGRGDLHARQRDLAERIRHVDAQTEEVRREVMVRERTSRGADAPRVEHLQTTLGRLENEKRKLQQQLDRLTKHVHVDTDTRRKQRREIVEQLRALEARAEQAARAAVHWQRRRSSQRESGRPRELLDHIEENRQRLRRQLEGIALLVQDAEALRHRHAELTSRLLKIDDERRAVLRVCEIDDVPAGRLAEYGSTQSDERLCKLDVEKKKLQREIAELAKSMERAQAACSEYEMLRERLMRLDFEEENVRRELTREQWELHRRADRASDLIPYVRIRDIQRGQASRPSSWLSPEATQRVDVRQKLRAGDILLSKSGTIGKAGVVRNEAVGAIASQGLYVLRPNGERLDPHFLLAYLESSECKTWLDDRARGATVRHLSRRVLDELRVPLPTLQIQQRAGLQYREHGVDVLAFIAQLLSSDQRDPVVEWIDQALKLLPRDAAEIPNPLDLTTLDRLAAQVRPLRNAVAHERDFESPLAAWLMTLSRALEPLRGARNIPAGPGLLSVLQDSARELEVGALHSVKGHLPHEDKARFLTSLIGKVLSSAMRALHASVELAISTECESLFTDETMAFDLLAHNAGTLPLRDVNITTEPDCGGASIPYIAEGSTHPVHVKCTTSKAVGSIMVNVHWTAATIAGEQVHGTREIAINVVERESPRAERVMSDLGTSPYVCGDPVSRERDDVFFGREDILDKIRRQVAQSGNVVLLEGNRRSGKSSILRHLDGLHGVPGWLGVYCSLQGAEGSSQGTGVPTAEIFRELASSIAKSLAKLGREVPLPNGKVLPAGKRLGIAKACREGISTESAFSDFREYAETVLDILHERDIGLLLMLDEFDKLQEGIDNGVTSPQVPENIRFLVQTYPRLSAILTGSRRLKRLREEYWSALFGLGTRFGVSALPVDAAKRLVTEPVADRLTYSGEAIDFAISATACQPYLLQCLCNRVFDLATQLKTRAVPLDLVQRAADALVEDNEHFASLWDYAGTARRRLILAIAEREADGSDPLQLGVIQERLSKQGVEVHEDMLIADLDFLRELELIDFKDDALGGEYGLTIPLMGMWVHRQQDFAALVSRARMESEDAGG